MSQMITFYIPITVRLRYIQHVPLRTYISIVYLTTNNYNKQAGVINWDFFLIYGLFPTLKMQRIGALHGEKFRPI